MKVNSTLFQNSVVEGLFYSNILYYEYNNAQVHKGLKKLWFYSAENLMLCVDCCMSKEMYYPDFRCSSL